MMRKKELIANIRSLQSLRVGGEPDPAWLRSTRERLLSEIRAEVAAPARNQTFRERLAVARILLPHRLYQYVAKPVMVSSIALGMVLGGWVTTVSASYGTLPGDALYGVKLATERAQVTLAGSADAKAKLKVEFVGRRVDEVAKIVENPGAEKAKRVSTAVRRLKEDITTVQSNLDELKDSRPQQAVEVAKLVDRKTEEFHAALAAADVPPEVRGEVQEANELVADASVKAVTVLVETARNGTADISEQDAKTRVEGKISSLSLSVAKVAEQALSSGASSSTPVVTDQALVVLSEAKNLLAENNIDGALSKVIEGSELAKTAEKIATGVAVTATLGSGSSSSTPSTTVISSASSTLPAATSTSTAPTPLPSTTGSSTPRL